jgi:hypothetical protein
MTDELESLSTIVEKTYYARLELAKRILTRGRLWNTALISSSVASSVVGVAMLGDNSIYGPQGEFLWVVFGVLTLSASLIVTSARYGEQALLCRQSYRTAQRLSMEIWNDHKRTSRQQERNRLFISHNQRYQKYLDETLNHSQADYWRTQRRNPARKEQKSAVAAQPSTRRPRGILFFDTAATWAPIILSLGAFALVFPAVAWLAGG